MRRDRAGVGSRWDRMRMVGVVPYPPRTDVVAVTLAKPGAVRCADCGGDGPLGSSMTEARAFAKAEGWSRCYRGSGETWRCSSCRGADLPPHLTPTVTARGLTWFPSIPALHGAQAVTYESSNAEQACLWLSLRSPDDDEMTVQLPVEEALRLADQLRWLSTHHYQTPVVSYRGDQ